MGCDTRPVIATPQIPTIKAVGGVGTLGNAQRYVAYWVPGLDDEIDPDDALRLAFSWLDHEERARGGAGIIVMFAKKMMGNRPLLGAAAGRWDFISPRSRGRWPRGTGPVLCIWPPNDDTLELAEQLAHGSALCVIPGSLYDVAGWIARTKAQSVVQGASARLVPDLPEDMAESLRSMAWFGGHNAFLGGGEKERAIRVLNEIARRRDRPSRESLETFLRSCREVEHDGASRAGKWYEEILQGKRHRDYAGRIIV